MQAAEAENGTTREPSSANSGLKLGERVRIHSLEGRPELNETHGCVCKLPTEAADRHAVELESDGSRVLLREAKLQGPDEIKGYKPYNDESLLSALETNGYARFLHARAARGSLPAMALPDFIYQLAVAVEPAAAPKDVEPIVRWLQSGGSTDARSSKSPQRTLLMIFVTRGALQLVDMLLRRGADVNLRDSEGSSVIDLDLLAPPCPSSALARDPRAKFWFVHDWLLAAGLTSLEGPACSNGVAMVARMTGSLADEHRVMCLYRARTYPREHHWRQTDFLPASAAAEPSRLKKLGWTSFHLQKLLEENGHPALALSDRALELLSALLGGILDSLLVAASEHANEHNTDELSAGLCLLDNVRAGVRNVLVTEEGELLKHALTEGSQAVSTTRTTHGSEGGKVDVGKVDRFNSGLILPVTGIVRWMDSAASTCSWGVIDHVEPLAPIFFTAVIEYLANEFLELAGNCAHADGVPIVELHHLLHAIREDGELSVVYDRFPDIDGLVRRHLAFAKPAATQAAATQAAAAAAAAREASDGGGGGSGDSGDSGLLPDASVAPSSRLPPHVCNAAKHHGTLSVIHSWIVDGGGDMNARLASPPDGEDSILHAAASHGNEKAVELALEYGATIDMRNNDNDTALMHACSGGHERVVVILLSRGAGVDLVGNDGATSLHTSALHGHDRIVRLLLLRKATINVQDNDGDSELSMAARAFAARPQDARPSPPVSLCLPALRSPRLP